jgi:hypothetical protein
MPNTSGGFVEALEVEISSDGETWKTTHHGSFGNIRNDPTLRTVLFQRVSEARYIRFFNLRPPAGLTRVEQPRSRSSLLLKKRCTRSG